MISQIKYELKIIISIKTSFPCKNFAPCQYGPRRNPHPEGTKFLLWEWVTFKHCIRCQISYPLNYPFETEQKEKERKTFTITWEIFSTHTIKWVFSVTEEVNIMLMNFKITDPQTNRYFFLICILLHCLNYLKLCHRKFKWPFLNDNRILLEVYIKNQIHPVVEHT